MKKFASLILALALCMGLATTAFAVNSVGDTTVANEQFSYTLSQSIVGIEKRYMEDLHDEVVVYLVPAGTVVSAPAGRMLEYAYVVSEYFEIPDDYCDALTIDQANGVYEIASISYDLSVSDDEGIYLAVATSSNPAAPTAYASTQNVLVNGKSVEFQCYALKDKNGNDTNYIKLRDVANVLNGTSAQFQVGWDGAVNIETGKRYTPTGSEMSTPFSGNRTYETATAKTRINGTAAALSAILLKDDSGNGYTYYKLRDLGSALGFKVDWTAQKGIFIETT